MQRAHLEQPEAGPAGQSFTLEPLADQPSLQRVGAEMFLHHQHGGSVVGESGQVSADIHAKTIRIDGKVNGDICGTENVVISKLGNVRGNIAAPRVLL